MTGASQQGPRLAAAWPSARPQGAAFGQADGTSASANPAAVADGHLDKAALTLLQFQADMRKANTRRELGYFVANEGRAVLRAQQVIVFDAGRGPELAVQTISSLTRVDRSSPMVLWFESVVKAIRQAGDIGTIREFEADAFGGAFDAVQKTYPLRHLLWVPWPSTGPRTGCGMLLARTSPWTELDIKVANYLAGAFGHGWAAVARPIAFSVVQRATGHRALAVAAIIAAGLLLVPVPMTALAPVEVGPKETAIVTAGVEGVVRRVDVEPNAVVKVGQSLLSLDDTVLRNRAEIAEREVLIAETKYKKAAQLAFLDARGRHEMAIAKSELDLKYAERDYARELMQRTVIKAERDGVAFFADKRDLVGKPVAVGEKLMEVADPAASEFHIELPVADSIVFADGARVKVFLDSDPLNAIEAKLVRAAYKAAPREAQQFSFRLVAEARDAAMGGPRLGMRGTAQIYGKLVPLGFYLFRRPIAAMRQWSGL